MRKVIAPDAIADLAFLDRFNARGWYLDDLVLATGGSARRSHWLQSQPNLTVRIAEYQPLAIVTLLLGMRNVVEEAVRDASCKAERYAVLFPGIGQSEQIPRGVGGALQRLP